MNLGKMTLNPSIAASLTAVAAPQGQGYDLTSNLFLPDPNDGLTSSYIEVRTP
jgi:hypothetical protein